MVPDSVLREAQLFADLGVSCAAAYESYDLTFGLVRSSRLTDDDTGPDLCRKLASKSVACP
jgi:hypothetical protein